jgi:DME family drug/metabolite transporter
MQLTAHTLALAAALCSASATVCIRQGLRGSNPYTAFWINVVVGLIGLWGAVFLILPAEALRVQALPFFICSGLLGTVAGRLARFVGIQKVGASVAAAITNLNPFISTGLAIVLLGERVTLPILAGTLVIVLGTVLLSLSGKHVGFRAQSLAYPFLSAACFGVVAIIRKVGLSQAGPLFGSAVNITTAAIAFFTFLVVSGNRQTLVCRGRSLWYFIGAGAAENGGVFLVLVALSLGEVSVVVPLFGTAPLFVLLMSHMFLKGVEKLTWRVVLGVTLIVLGVFLLTA